MLHKASDMAAKGQGSDFPTRFGRFEGEVSVAKVRGDEFIETDQDIIKFLQPNGTGKVPYFVYKGIKIFPIGYAKNILKNEQVPMEEILHGKSETGIREVNSNNSARS